MFKNFVSALRPYKRAHCLVYEDRDTVRYAIYKGLAFMGGICEVTEENSQGATFKIDLVFSAN